MLFIAHRINTIEELKNVPKKYGVEIDIRGFGKRLIIQHEPFKDGIDFENWLKYYNHKFIILNVKEEGIEYKVKALMGKYNIQEYFFLDLSFPYLVKMANAGEKRVAIRFSEYESINTALAMAGKATWAWVDCFTKMPLGKKEYTVLARHFKICVVSPELQGRSIEEIEGYKRKFSSFPIDAVCTKRIDLWLDAGKG
ncbi:MAG: hypothetical protein PHC37_05490 [Candidatus Omnitrophica bacterium]|jgi:hypothetical protein|nr:hypothetical protein [Candidatus Omnitrophota bacterium]